MKYTEADLKLMFEEGIKLGMEKAKNYYFFLKLDSSSSYDSGFISKYFVKSLFKLNRIKNKNLTKYNPSSLNK